MVIKIMAYGQYDSLKIGRMGYYPLGETPRTLALGKLPNFANSITLNPISAVSVLDIAVVIDGALVFRFSQRGRCI